MAKLPNAGLGNKLFVWARATVFAHLNQLPIYVIGLNQIHIGPFLRREKVKRFYFGQFNTNPLHVKLIYIKHLLLNTPKVIEPDISIYPNTEPTIFLFDTIPSWKDYFKSIRDHRKLIRQEFEAILSDKVKKRLSGFAGSQIGVHIRLGDFKKLPANMDFKTLGTTRTPLTYFESCITSIRQKYKTIEDVTIFSDGHRNELTDMLSIPNVSLNETDLDVVDLIKLSKSKIIITSAHSSFSEWAGFLSDSPIIRHPDHIHGKIRPEGFEGSVSAFLTS